MTKQSRKTNHYPQKSFWSSMDFQKKSKKKNLNTKRKNTSTRSFLYKIKILLITTISIIIANTSLQLWRKPIEVLHLNPFAQYKTLHQTWNQYKEAFKEAQTHHIPATLLAAIAQTESSGHPTASPPWIWRWTLDITRIYSPQSSAFGLMQITQGTFQDYLKFCKRNSSCSQSFNSRASAKDSIFLSANYLHTQIKRLLKQQKRNLSVLQKQTLAAMIHLCGTHKAKKLFKNNMSVNQKWQCGYHHVQTYVSKINKLAQRLRQKNPSLLAAK